MATELMSVCRRQITRKWWRNRVALNEPPALNIKGNMVERVVRGERGVPVFEEGEADKVIAGDGECRFVPGSDADDAALATQAGGDIEIVVNVEGHALSAAESL